MELRFTKMHGLGNDYIYFNCFNQPISNPEELAVRLSDRHKGIGGDGIVLICKSEVADAKMRMFNIDGSEGKMCGNAIRCVAKYLYDTDISKKALMTVETLSGIKTLRLFLQDGQVQSVCVNMGKPVLSGKDIPCKSNGETVVKYPLTVAGETYEITAVSMGNPHCVTFVSDVKNFDVSGVGAKIEKHEFFPDRVNVEFAQMLDDRTIAMRVYERGSGETMACGTGACATVVAAVLNGKCARDADVTVKLLGGDLIIKYTENGVYMTGTADKVFDGVINV